MLKHTSHLRRIAATTGVLAAVTAATLGAVTGSGAATAEPRTDGPHRTTLTFEVPGCAGCRVQLHHDRETQDPPESHVWHSKAKKVRDGVVSFDVRSSRTHGMTTTVVAPWEGHTGYLTTVAYRYAGTSVGDEVTFREARHTKRASACWEGTRRDEVTIPLTVRQVKVLGVTERVQGSIAYADTTLSWLDPMRRAPHGVLGSQDVDICG